MYEEKRESSDLCVLDGVNGGLGVSNQTRQESLQEVKRVQEIFVGRWFERIDHLQKGRKMLDKRYWCYP